MRKYELVVILEPTRTDEQIAETLDKIENVITTNGGVIESRDSWGKRRLAYPINRKRDGHYTLILFDAEPDGLALAELNRYLRINEETLRFLITKAVVGKSRGQKPPEDAGYESRGGRFLPRNSFSSSRGPRPRREDYGSSESRSQGAPAGASAATAEQSAGEPDTSEAPKSE